MKEMSVESMQSVKLKADLPRTLRSNTTETICLNIRQGGFNAGDGVRFYVINGSRTNDILNLPSTSNVARPGQWIFRTDEAGVEAGGCNSKGK